MRIRVRLYVGFVTTAALVWGLVLWRVGPASPDTLRDALLLCALAIAGEVLSFLLPRSTSASLAFIPYFASAIIVPSWPSVLGVLLVKSGVELLSRRAAIKGIFNVATHVLMECVAVSVYVALGGRSLLGMAQLEHLTQITRTVGFAALVAFVAALALNNLLVAIVVAFSSERPVVRVLRENHGATIGLDLLVTPLVFVFAWVYADFGAVAAAALWVPILGLRQVHKTNLELEQNNEELLQLMIKSIEARDTYTSGHSRRVELYSTTIARAVGLAEREVQHVRRAALLHDVGKIHEKYAAVLAKADKLTAEEWALIKEHPGDGANLVATMTRLRDVVPAIRSHHENWDGTGYPDGIAGELIPLAARIIRFADTIDAMTSERPYRRPLGEPEVRAELVRCRGTQFDPAITDRLLSSSLWHSIFVPTDHHEVVRAPLAVVRTGLHVRSAPPAKQA